jgi:hypothetical protein
MTADQIRWIDGNDPIVVKMEVKLYKDGRVEWGNSVLK